MTARHWVFTLNNYTFEESIAMYDLKCRYAIWGFEIAPDAGTPHLQGYIEMKSPVRLTHMKKLIPRAHFEKRQKSREAARDYCKKDEEYDEIGEWDAGGQGSRTDLHGLMESIKEHMPVREIMEENPNVYSRNMRFIQKYTEVIEKDETRDFRKVNVEVLVGDAGSGKTRKAFEENPGIFTVNADEAFPFDGYDGEEAILIDDFYGDIKYHNFLRILDGHQYRVNVKGSHRYARWTKIVITSNKKAEEWYKVGLTPALRRRLTTVTEFNCHEETGNTSAVSLEMI